MALFECKKESGITPVLLWTNQNPTSAFTAQTVNVDTTTYKDFIIKFKSSTATAYSGYTTTYYLKSNDIVPTNYEHYLCAKTDGISYRVVNITSSGLSFGTGSRAYSSGTSSANQDIIPLEIYGVKKTII